MTLFLKPGRDGLLVRDPVTGKPLDPNGETKPRNSYWLRRISDGDAVKAKPTKSAKASAAADATDKSAK